MIHTSPEPSTNSSDSTSTAITAYIRSSSGRRRTRSTQCPSSGAARPGAVMMRNTTPAAASDPVRSLIQMARER